MTPLYLGIDTGGTFTDGVLLDPIRQTVVKTAKVLTTHHDLKVCIENVLESLLAAPDEGEGVPLAEIRMVSLSTTLATNAIVEGKSRPVALFLIGYDLDLVYQYHFEQQFGTSNFFFIAGGMDLQGREQCALDETALQTQAGRLQGQVEAFAVSSYGGSFNSSHEERAAEQLAGFGLPVVLGHHLSGRLDSIRRATTASLNAALLSTTYDFMHTVQEMLARRGIQCPLVMVKGDGSLASADYAAHRPVEIIHSGPATSAIGGLYLAGVDLALVVDIGGTTTDLALVQNGHTVLEGGEATVGGYRTSVRTIRARSFGLGGDSQIAFEPRGLFNIGPGRVIPISYLASLYPQVKQDLLEWLSAAPDTFYSNKIEYWLLCREPNQAFKDPRTNQVIEMLRAGPRRLPVLLKQVNVVSQVQVDGDLLARQDIIARAGLTPTDLLHVTGEYTPWDAEAASGVVEAVARMWNMPVETFIQTVRQRMTRMISAEIIHFLSGHAVPESLPGARNGSLAHWLFEESLSPADPFLGCRVQLKVPLVGIGAPARAFLAPVADALGTEMIFPAHYQVANAVGTVVGNVLVQREGEVIPLLSGSMRIGYLARAGSEQRQFEALNEALTFARDYLQQQVRDEALAAGALAPEVVLTQRELLGEIYQLAVVAVGKPGQEN